MSDTSSEPPLIQDELPLLPMIERFGFCKFLKVDGAALHFYEVDNGTDQILMAIEVDGSDARIILPLNTSIYWDLMNTLDSNTLIKEVFRILSFWYTESSYSKLQIKVTKLDTDLQQTAGIPKKYAPEFIKSMYSLFNFEALATKLQKFKETES